MSAAVLVRCPAKFNTFLSVGAPDPSGYHPLRTVFQALSLYDELVVAESDRDAVASDWDGLPADNTLTKTLRLTRELAPLPPLSITLRKRIPAQSGLGGGSSDAAGLLRALSVLYPSVLSTRDRWEIAQAVGADVPFFLVGGLARGEGYGERVSPLEDPAREWLVLARPEVGVSTVEAYRALDAVPRPWLEFPSREAPWHNDFERVMPSTCVEAAEGLLAAGALATVLCGSGSVVAGRAESETHAKRIVETIEVSGLESWVVHTLTRVESLVVSPEFAG